MLHLPLRNFAMIAVSAILIMSCQPGSQAPHDAAQSDHTHNMEEVYLHDLETGINALDSLEKAHRLEDAGAFLSKARMSFKRLEPILAFTDAHNYKTLNQPNLLKVEEEDATNIRIKNPGGFQVMEELLYADSIDWNAIHEQAGFTKGRLKLIQSNASLKHLKPYHVLWIAQQTLARVAFTGITGYDSPVLSASLNESAAVLSSLQDYIYFYEDLFSQKQLAEQWNAQLNQAILDLKEGDFDTFDRYNFIKNRIHPLLTSWNAIVTDWGVQFPFALALRNDAQSFFSAQTFNQSFFSDPKMGSNHAAKTKLGKQLFNDKGLSASQTMSCGTCHKEDLAFSDGLKLSKGQNRNSPSLTYTALQQKFFHDGRAGSLEGQIVSVVNNDTEFHSDLEELTKAVKANKTYVEAFDSLYAGEITDMNIRHALASYVRSLSPFNSQFDQNINGVRDDLSEEAKQGFNLFMGKAACATCHFPPTFNGTIPPNFTETELELIGVPGKADTAHASIDPDPGAWNLFHTPERKFFFKTPSIRNVAKTAPYMHNGVYATLEEVIDFYNRGGGLGIGIEIDNQTLPGDPLELNATEQAALVAFMKTLTDEEYQ